VHRQGAPCAGNQPRASLHDVPPSVSMPVHVSCSSRCIRALPAGIRTTDLRWRPRSVVTPVLAEQVRASPRAEVTRCGRRSVGWRQVAIGRCTWSARCPSSRCAGPAARRRAATG